jgi:SpoVK/Ycf46/Vps4 family AAA+-type ATPase
MNPSNGRGVEKLLETAYSNLKSRVLKVFGLATPPRVDMVTLATEDVQDPPKLSLDEFWADFDRNYKTAACYKELKAQLGSIQNAVQLQLKDFGEFSPQAYNFVITGPPGTGKTTVANSVLAPFFCALGIIPFNEVVQKRGADLQARYVGQTVGAVDDIFKEGWGKVIFLDEISAICGPGAAFANDAIKGALLSYLEDNPGRFIFAIADYPENIAMFMALDAGLQRRFAYTIALRPWDSETSLQTLLRNLAKPPTDGGRGLDLRAQAALLKKHLDQIVQIVFQDPQGKFHGFASGGSVRTLGDKIFERYAARRTECTADADLDTVKAAAIDDACRELTSDLEDAVNAAKRTRRWTAHTGLAMDLKVDIEQPPEVAPGGGDDPELKQEEFKRIQKAMAEVDEQQRFKDRYNTSPEKLAQDEADPTSEYNKELGKVLGVEPAEAMKLRVRVAVTVKKLVQRTKSHAIQKFQYHCPFCGQIESRTCGYINHPMEWKLAHSLRKPWTEHVTTTELVEVEEEAFEERDVS